MDERPHEGHAGTVPQLVLRFEPTGSRPSRDVLVAEEPLEIRVREGLDGAAVPFVITMRTPGDDEDLAVGLLYGEGVIEQGEEVLEVARSRDIRLDEARRANVVEVALSPGRPLADRLPRRPTVMGSACGVCGRTTIEEVLALAERSRGARRGPAPAASGEALLTRALLASLPGTLRKLQRVFADTGGLHATGLFAANGTPVLVREDVGRHNATDKAVGALLRSGAAPPPVLLVSGRLGFEIVQKAALCGVAVVAGLSAPTSLAVELAEETGLTLVGFLRGETFNVYAHPGRLSP